jgi:hypothetical protein
MFSVCLVCGCVSVWVGCLDAFVCLPFQILRFLVERRVPSMQNFANFQHVWGIYQKENLKSDVRGEIYIIVLRDKKSE